MINQFNLVDDVIMPGWVEEEDMPLIYNGANAFVFPSKYEGFGIPLLEAMASHIPVIASHSSSIPEVVGQAAWLFDPAYALSIAKAMERVVTEPEGIKKLIKEGTEQANKFSWKKSAEETLSLINNILSSK
jgi:glycosyltransferase involved in cell wall biosynthesis